MGRMIVWTASQALLPNGKLVIAGGWPDPFSTYTWELYDPGHGNFDRDRPDQC